MGHAPEGTLPLPISECLQRQQEELQKVLRDWVAEHHLLQASQDLVEKELLEKSEQAKGVSLVLPEDRAEEKKIAEISQAFVAWGEPQDGAKRTKDLRHLATMSDLDSENSLEQTQHKSALIEGAERKRRSERPVVVKKPSVFDNLQRFCHGVLRHRCFDPVCGSVIFLNAAVIGVQVEYEAWNPRQELGIWIVTQTLFCIAYVVEVSLRICGQGRNFFGVVDWRWNCFDLFVTLASIVDLLLTFALEPTSEVGALGAARMLRLIRVAKIIRVVRYLRNVRAMIFTLLHTLSSLGWSLALMAMIMFLFAVAITEAVTAHLLQQGTGSAAVLVKYWGTIGSSMYTLLLSITGGINWEEAAAALETLHLVYLQLFVLYICFMVFAMMNVVTGFFCEHAFEMARSEKDSLIQEQLRQKHLYVKHFRQLFSEGDADGSGTISFGEFERFVEDEHLQAYLAHLNVDPENAWQIFRLIDCNKDGEVSIDEFTTGLLTMKGPAKALDLKSIDYNMNKESKRMQRRMQYIDAQLKEIQSLLTARVAS